MRRPERPRSAVRLMRSLSRPPLRRPRRRTASTAPAPARPRSPAPSQRRPGPAPGSPVSAVAMAGSRAPAARPQRRWSPGELAPRPPGCSGAAPPRSWSWPPLRRSGPCWPWVPARKRQPGGSRWPGFRRSAGGGVVPLTAARGAARPAGAPFAAAPGPRGLAGPRLGRAPPFAVARGAAGFAGPCSVPFPATRKTTGVPLASGRRIARPVVPCCGVPFAATRETPGSAVPCCGVPLPPWSEGRVDEPVLRRAVGLRARCRRVGGSVLWCAVGLH